MEHKPTSSIAKEEGQLNTNGVDISTERKVFLMQQAVPQFQPSFQ